MNKHIFLVMIVLSAFWSSGSFAEQCFTVDGEVKTVNLGSAQQGTIKLVLLDENDNEVLRQQGSIIGVITGASSDFSRLFLSHQAMPETDNSFLTTNDTATITGIRKVAADGNPCSYFVKENITHIAFGTGLFSKVSNVDVLAEGYTSACFDDSGNISENENEFELSGTLCVNP